MKKSIKLIVTIAGALMLITLFVIVEFDKEAEYSFTGKYSYKIVNDSLFEQTYLFDSYGYLIGDLNIQGLKIYNVDSLVQNKDYIISLNYPIVKVFKSSELTRSEGLNTVKEPLEIVIDKTSFTNDIYIYKLKEENKYRLILP